MEILKIKNLIVELEKKKNYLKIIDGIDLSLKKGEILGIAGESGSGKTVSMFSLTKLLPQPPWEIRWDEFSIEGKGCNFNDFGSIKNLRGKFISYIFQDPIPSLDPMFTIESQLKEILINFNEDYSLQNMKKILLSVELKEPDRIFDSYPHQLSGGMAQRVAIALAISSHPKVLIADEPTTALDANIRRSILDLFKNLCNENLSIIFISHDLYQISYLADKIAILYAGRIMEEGTKEDIIKHPSHPYTIALFDCLPQVEKGKNGLSEIKGEVPNFESLPSGCKFHLRCKHKIEICEKKEPELIGLEKGHFSRCHLASKIWKKYLK
jgi:oligopeptide/dipeptide ABC transporter ATP-binding protein